MNMIEIELGERDRNTGRCNDNAMENYGLNHEQFQPLHIRKELEHSSNQTTGHW